MIQRKSSPFKRFLLALLWRALRLALLVLALSLGMFVWVRAGRSARAVTLERPESSLQPPSRAPESLRLLTYNIAHARGPVRGAANTDGGGPEEKRARLEAIGHRLQSLNLDLVFLQEVDFNTWWSGGVDQAAILAKSADFPYIVRQRTIDTGLPFFRRYDFGNVLLSRFPVEKIEWLRMPPYSHVEDFFAGNHDGLVAQVRIGAEQTVLIVGVHLEVRSEDVRVQAAGEIIRVQRQHEGIPVIVMGDLNSTPPPLPDSQTSASGQNTIELLESFGGFQRRPVRGQTRPVDFTFPTQGPRRVIDWILPDRNWAFLQYEVLRDLKESDHLPVLATLRKR